MNQNRDTKKGVLYVVATPIGNLEDISLRAIRTLKEVALIAAEDTRHTGRLLKAYKIPTPLISLHGHNEKGKSSLVISKICSGMNVAYVSDAGTPCVSDPGHYLISFAHAENIRVIPIPGASAVIAAMSASGFPADNFVFCGFLPARETKRRKFLSSLINEQKTIVFYESPLRLLALLQDIYKILGDREIVLARELTKIFEEIKRGKISELIEKIGKNKVKGEITLIVQAEQKKLVNISDEEIRKKLLTLRKNKKLTLRDAVTEVVKNTGLSKKRVYALAVKFLSVEKG
ncbi:MAG: 16S rRNA (cytidine(1402)-2'-O)-methyltransferase [Deltaproteobacteria bacterium RBG_19FT_COMBO_43_11]|nr:MAG: 16S rRNA (cytidine(1402)-2'-O)-methyltransferase [Deltaproteobacteria bacterium RBG_19FT_COMBO_43_11]